MLSKRPARRVGTKQSNVPNSSAIFGLVGAWLPCVYPLWRSLVFCVLNRGNLALWEVSAASLGPLEVLWIENVPTASISWLLGVFCKTPQSLYHTISAHAKLLATRQIPQMSRKSPLLEATGGRQGHPLTLTPGWIFNMHLDYKGWRSTLIKLCEFLSYWCREILV